MKKQFIVVVAGAILFFISESASAQSDTPRVEIGAQYTFLDLSSIPSRDFFIIQSSGGRHGFGGRVKKRDARTTKEILGLGLGR